MQGRWLFLGEASYRFSLAVARSGASRGVECVASSFSDLDGEEKQRNRHELETQFGFECFDNVDATKLELHQFGRIAPPFTRVFFMFPHAPKVRFLFSLLLLFCSCCCFCVSQLLFFFKNKRKDVLICAANCWRNRAKASLPC
jgi:hypothetical protein